MSANTPLLAVNFMAIDLTEAGSIPRNKGFKFMLYRPANASYNPIERCLLRLSVTLNHKRITFTMEKSETVYPIGLLDLAITADRNLLPMLRISSRSQG
jgi:hypothetical protein